MRQLSFGTVDLSLHREYDPEEGACSAEQQAFGEQLTDQAAAAGPDRSAHRHLPLACRTPSQQEVGEVCAHHEHHEQHGCRQQSDGRSESAAQVITQRANDRGELLQIRIHQRFGFGLRRGDGRARRQAPDETEGVAGPIRTLAQREGRNEIDATVGCEDLGEAEGGREHSDDRGSPVVEIDLRAHHSARAIEDALPAGVGEEDRRRTVVEDLVVSEEPAHDRLHPQHVEEVAGHPQPRRAQRGVPEAHRVIARPIEEVVATHVVELGRDRAQRLEVTRLHADARQRLTPAEVAVGYPDQALRLVEGQRSQQKRAGDAEDGHARADSEPDHDHGEGGESRVTAERADTGAYVAGDLVGQRGPSSDGDGEEVERGAHPDRRAPQE